MSYILDALRKSDQQRRRGEVPSLQAAQPAVGEKPTALFYGLAGAALVAAGVAIGWFHPWRQEPVAVASAAPDKRPEPASAGSPPLRPQAPPAPAFEPPAPPAKSAPAAAADQPMASSELPAAIQQALPPMAVAMHVYSSQPRDRLVSIDNRVLREGDHLAAELRLEEITPTGAIFSYRGYRFRRGVQ